MRLSHCFGACVLLATLTAASASPAAAATGKTTATRLGAADRHEPRIIFGRVNQSEASRTINPCWFLRTDVYQEALQNSNLRVRLHIRFQSDGKWQHFTLDVAPTTARNVTAETDWSQFPQVATPADYTHLIVTGVTLPAVPDAGTAFDVHINLYTAGEDEGSET